MEIGSPLVLPWHGSKAVRAFNRRLIEVSKRRYQKSDRTRDWAVVCCVPTALDLALALAPELLVYYCLDDFSTLPGLDWGMVKPYEQELVAAADLVVVSSPQLTRLPRLAGQRMAVLRHGVDYERFAEAGRQELPRLAGLPGELRKPVIVYSGTIDERIDLDLLEAVGTGVAGTLLLVGGCTVDLSRLLRWPNVIWRDYVPYSEVPAVLSLADVLIAPYVVCEMTATLEPLKLREYLATGRPVVATALPAFLEYEDVVHVARERESFIDFVRLAASNGAGAGRRQQRAAAESWTVRARVFLEMLDALPERGRAA